MLVEAKGTLSGPANRGFFLFMLVKIFKPVPLAIYIVGFVFVGHKSGGGNIVICHPVEHNVCRFGLPLQFKVAPYTRG